MRPVSSELAAYLDTTTATPPMAHLITLTLRGGQIERWTDWPAALTIGGYTFETGGPGTGRPLPVIGEREEVAGTEIGKLGITLQCGNEAQLSGVRFPLAAMRGALKGATVKVERVYMPAPGDLSLGSMHIFEGPVGEVRASSLDVELDVESGLAALSTMLPRLVFQSGCVNMLYDAQCLVSQSGRTCLASVTGTLSTTSVVFVGTGFASATQVTGYFNLGVLTFTSGINEGQSRAVRSDTWSSPNHTVVLDRALSWTPSAGDEFSIYPGCDKLLATCDDKFDNVVHFRGWPFVPRNEAAL